MSEYRTYFGDEIALDFNDEISDQVVKEPQAEYPKYDSGIQVWNDLVFKSIISRAGIAKEYFERLKNLFGLTNNQFQKVFAITWKSIQNRETKERVNGPSVDRAIGLMELWDEGFDYFENEEKLINWLKKSNAFFSGHAPIEQLDTPAGVEMVRRKIGQLKHGITA